MTEPTLTKERTRQEPYRGAPAPETYQQTVAAMSDGSTITIQIFADRVRLLGHTVDFEHSAPLALTDLGSSAVTVRLSETPEQLTAKAKAEVIEEAMDEIMSHPNKGAWLVLRDLAEQHRDGVVAHQTEEAGR